MDDLVAKKREHHRVFSQQVLHADLKLGSIQGEYILLKAKELHRYFYIRNIGTWGAFVIATRRK